MKVGRLLLLLAIAACVEPPSAEESPSTAIRSHEVSEFARTAVFGRVRDMAIGGDALWVLDSSAPFLTRISLRDPSAVLRFGVAGGGPGEFGRPVAVQATSEGARIWDPGKNQVMTFRGDGTLYSAEPLSMERSARVRPDILDVTYVDPWRIRRIGEDVAYARFPHAVNHTSHFANGSLALTDDVLSAGTPVAPLAQFVPLDGPGMSQFAPMPLWDGCGDGIAIWDPRGELVRWIDTVGRLVDSLAVDLPPSSIDRPDIERYLRHVARLELGPGFESSGIDFAKEVARVRDLFRGPAPAVADIRCTTGGVVWLQLFDMTHHPLGLGRVWAKVEAGSTPVLIEFPPHYRPYLFTDGGIAFGVSDGTEGQALALWKSADPATQ